MKPLYNKIFCSLLSFSFLFPSITYAEGMSQSTMMQLLSAMNGGYKISNSVRYMYYKPDDIPDLVVQCRAMNKASKNPKVGTKGTYACYALSKKVYFPSSVVSTTIDFKDNSSQTVKLPMNYYKKVEMDDGTEKKVSDSFTITITAEAEENSTTAITANEVGAAATDATEVSMINDGKNNQGTNNGGNNGGGNDGGRWIDQNNPKGNVDTDNGGLKVCSDGTFFCPEDIKRVDPNGRVDDPTKQHPNNPTNINDKPKTYNPILTPPTNNTDRKWGDLIGSLLNDRKSNPYSSGDNDWARSNGGTGSPDLNNYFNTDNSTGDEPTPDGLSNDILGNDNPDGPLTYSTGEDKPIENAGDYYIKDGNNYYGDGDNNKEDSNSSGLPMNDLEQMYQDGLAGLDTLTGDNSNLLGAITKDTADSSLAQKLKELMGDNSISNNKRGTATDQEMYDIAKKLLLASGYSMDDLRNGRNYDANSAYTEPTTAWDLNRITTLLTGRRISLTSPSEIKKNTNNTISNNVKK